MLSSGFQMNEWIVNRGSRATLHQQMGRGRGAHPPFLLSIIHVEPWLQGICGAPAWTI